MTTSTLPVAAELINAGIASLGVDTLRPIAEQLGIEHKGLPKSALVEAVQLAYAQQIADAEAAVTPEYLCVIEDCPAAEPGAGFASVPGLARHAQEAHESRLEEYEGELVFTRHVDVVVAEPDEDEERIVPEDVAQVVHLDHIKHDKVEEDGKEWDVELHEFDDVEGSVPVHAGREPVRSDFFLSEDGIPKGGYSHAEGIDIQWQHGTEEPTGAIIEDVLTLADDRLAFFQTTRFACAENQMARNFIRQAQSALKARQHRRKAAGTEGTYEGH